MGEDVFKMASLGSKDFDSNTERTVSGHDNSKVIPRELSNYVCSLEATPPQKRKPEFPLTFTSFTENGCYIDLQNC